MDVKATLKVINQTDCPGRRGVTDGQTYQRMIGWPEILETDRVRLGRATYAPGTYEQLHWHPIEACYYVISGHATVRDFEGREYEVGPGSSYMRRRASRAPTSGRSRSRWKFSTSARPLKPTARSSTRSTRKPSGRTSIWKTLPTATRSASSRITR